MPVVPGRTDIGPNVPGRGPAATILSDRLARHSACRRCRLTDSLGKHAILASVGSGGVWFVVRPLGGLGAAPNRRVRRAAPRPPKGGTTNKTPPDAALAPVPWSCVRTSGRGELPDGPAV